MSQYEIKDLANPTAYEDPKKMDELFIRLRKENPIPLVDVEGYRPFWAITKSADILEIESKRDIFRAGPQVFLMPKSAEDELVRKFGHPYHYRTMMRMDPPDHMLYRNLLQSWFSPDGLAKLASTMKEISMKHIEELISHNGECDYMSIIKFHTIRVFTALMGLPPEDEGIILKLTHDYLFPHDPDISGNMSVQDVLTKNAEDTKNYYSKIIAERKLNPRDDVLSAIANGKINGEPISEEQQIALLLTLTAGGHDTTGATIAQMMITFAEHPELLKQLKENPGLIPNAVEEMLRWTCPVKSVMRNAIQDYEIRGQKIKAGDRLLLCFQSACRDEDVIEDPFIIRFDRKMNRHLAFGSGPHICMGQYLARIEITTLFRELIPRLESVELNGEYNYFSGFFVIVFKKLPIKYKIT